LRNIIGIDDKQEALRSIGRMKTTSALLLRNLIKVDRREVTARASFTVITDNGRKVLAQALAEWADAMERAQQFMDDVKFKSQDALELNLVDYTAAIPKTAPIPPPSPESPPCEPLAKP
jgi:hypothetical protein